jgi:chromate reductase
MKVLAISGSLRRDSHNTALARAAAELLPPSAELEIFDGLKAVEPYDHDDDVGGGPSGAGRLRQAIESADAVLIATPEYNSSVPGQLKNAIDWASRPYGDNAWNGKPAAILSAAMSMGGGVRAQYQLRQSFVFLNVEAVLQPEVAIGNATERFDEQGNLKDETSKKLIRQLLQNLVQKVRLLTPAMKAAA